MIDIETLVFNTVANAVQAEVPNAEIYGEYVEAPATFPCVYIVEDSNTTYEESLDESGTENHARISYEINVYSDKRIGKKSFAKRMMDIVDDAMQGMYFVRTFRGQTPNLDRTVYRYTSRYEAIVSKGYQEGDDIVHYIYRRI